MKVEIKQLCQQYTLSVTQDISRSMKDLETEIVELQSLLESTGNQDHIEDLKCNRSALKDLLGTEARGALLRSVLMDAPSKYFFNLEKKIGQNRFIHKIKSAAGQELKQPQEIRRRILTFYADLYKREYQEHQGLFHPLGGVLPRVPENIAAELEEALTLQDLSTALQGLTEARPHASTGYLWNSTKSSGRSWERIF